MGKKKIKKKRVKKAVRVAKVKKIKKPKKAVKVKKKKGGKKGPVIAYLGLGSNVGDREEYIEQAVFLLDKNPKIEVLRRSSNYETAAEGGKSQAPFINAALAIKTSLSPQQLLEAAQIIENALGREREVEWGPRTIDIDILFYGNEIISTDTLQVPHPLLHERLFVLKPLREVAPSLIHPVLEKSVEALYEERKAEAEEKYDDELPGFKEIREAHSDDFERW